MAKACAYSCQHRLWRQAGVGEFGEMLRACRQCISIND